jgi:hypothetical protein
MSTDENTLSRSDLAMITADIIASAHRVDQLFKPLQQNKEDTSQTMLRLHNERLAIENETLKENRTMRRTLIRRLSWVSFLWLFFTGFMVCCLAFSWFSCHLSDVVATAFITTSLATVLGLWMIGLRYFFSPRVDAPLHLSTSENHTESKNQ